MGQLNVVSAVATVAEKKREQISITLNEACQEDLEEICRKMRIPLASFIRDIVEAEWRSPSFGALQRRLNEREERKRNDAE